MKLVDKVFESLLKESASVNIDFAIHCQRGTFIGVDIIHTGHNVGFKIVDDANKQLVEVIGIPGQAVQLPRGKILDLAVRSGPGTYPKCVLMDKGSNAITGHNFVIAQNGKTLAEFNIKSSSFEW